MKIRTYRNKRNPNKYFNLKHYADGHYYYIPFMHWANGVTNVIGQRGCRYWRCRKSYIKELMEDYEEVS